MEITRRTRVDITYQLTEEECVKIIRDYMSTMYGPAWQDADIAWEVRQDLLYGVRLKTTREEVS